MLLINASSRDTTKIFQAFYPIHPPVGIGCLISYARTKSVHVNYIDQQLETKVFERVAEYIRDMEKPYIFGFSVLTAGLKTAVETAKVFKETYPDSFIVFGGVHPSMVPEEIMKISFIDGVIRGEGENPLVELYKALKSGNDYSFIDNLSYRRGGKIIHNPINFIIQDLNLYPPFPYHIFTHESYDMGFVISSRGCPFRCIFCSISSSPGGRRYRYRHEKFIVDDIELLYHQYNLTSIIFLDDNFLVDKKRIYALIGEIRKRELHKKLKLVFQARGDSIDYNLLKHMFDSGFKVILFGIETASEKIMLTVQKGETVRECVDGIRLAKEIGYYVSGTFVFALPGENHQDRMNCLNLSKELCLDEVRFNNAVPYPGTELFEIGKKEGCLHIEEFYENFIAVSAITETPFERVPLPYVPLGNTESEIKRDVLLCSFASYISVMDIWGIVFKKNSQTKWFSMGKSKFQQLKKVPAAFYLGFMLCIKLFQLVFQLFINPCTKLSRKEVFRAVFLKRSFESLYPRLKPNHPKKRVM